MTYKELQRKITTPFFTINQLKKIFFLEDSQSIRVAVSRMYKRGDLIKLKRGLYLFTDQHLDELVIANLLYQPSYISLETALNNYGLIPDISAQITGVTTITTKFFSTFLGDFSYSKIKKSLFFGFQKIVSQDGLTYNLAFPEKALLDYLYIRRSKVSQLRLDKSILGSKKLVEYSCYYPQWVRKALHE